MPAAAEKHLGRVFLADIRGGVRALFAVSALPAIGLVAAGIDYARAHNYEGYLQTLLDQAAIASARDYGRGGNVATAENRLRDAVLAGLERRSREKFRVHCWIERSSGKKGYVFDRGPPTAADAPCTSIEPASIAPHAVVLKGASLDTGSSSITPTITAGAPNVALRFMGMGYIAVAATSSARLAAQRLEVALAIGTGASMSENAGGMSKLAALKLATRDLLAILEPTLASGATRIGVVPFSEGVHLDARIAATTVAPSPATRSVQLRSEQRPGAPADATYKRTACVADGFEAASDAAPSEQARYAALYNRSGTCAQAATVQPLTSKAAAIQATVESLAARGGSAGHVGMQWAWNVLSPNWAGTWGADDAAATNAEKDVRKVAILVADGQFNLQFCEGIDDRVSSCRAPGGTSPDHTRAICETMKAQGIVIYTVGMQVDGREARDTLIACASPMAGDAKRKLYYFPYSGEDVKAVFADIGNQLKASQSGRLVGRLNRTQRL